jgi:hypothetical protein
MNKQFLLYLFKWQISAVVTIPLMYFFVDYLHMSYWVTTVLFNFIGSLIFFPIDQWIFKRNAARKKVS